MDTSQKTESIKQLIDQVQSKNIVLPEFQRDFVWELNQTYDLFDSLVRDIFIGSLIYGVPSFEITVRDIDTRPRKGNGSRQRPKLTSFTKKQINEKVKTGGFRLLLDGQQRVTSLYRALTGVDHVWIILRNDDELPPETKAKPFAARTLEELLLVVQGVESSDHMSVRISDVYEMLEGKITREKDKAQILAGSAFGRQHNPENLRDSELFDQYIRASDKIQDLLKAEKLLSYYLLDTDAEKFSLFFERSNSKGIQLNFIDILAAKLYAGFNLRKSIDTFEDENPDYRLNREIIVRAIAMAVSNNTDVGRNYILNKLTAAHFNDHWNNFCNLYKRSIDYLYSNSFLLSQDWMPYENMLLPIMMFLRELPHHDFSQMNHIQAAFLRFWYWGSIFSERYSLAAQTILVEDTKAFVSVAKQEYDFQESYLEKIRGSDKTIADIRDVYRKGSAIYRGVFNLINYTSEGILDWKNGDKLSFNSRLEDHHIFPREYLRRTDPAIDQKSVDCVLNRALVPKITNIKIGAKRPSEYLAELRDSNPKLADCLASHHVPPDILSGTYDDIYEIFLEDRAKDILGILNEELKAYEMLRAELFPEESREAAMPSNN